MATKKQSITNAPSNTVAEKKFAWEQSYSQRMKDNFAKAEQAVRKLRDPNGSNTIYTINSYTRDTIRNYLKQPASNESNLRNVTKYLFYRSQVFYRLIMFYSTMFDLNSRKVIPKFDLVKSSNDKKMLSAYNKSLDQLDIYNLQGNSFELLVNSFLYDVVFALFLRDDTGAFFYILDPSECMIDGRYMTGDLSFSVDMSKWRSKARQSLIEWIGEPLTSMYREYESSGMKYIHVPDEYACCIKFRIDNLNSIIPPFSGILQEVSQLIDLADIQAIADAQSIYKLLVFKLGTLTGAKQANDFEIDPDLAAEYYNTFIADALPPYVSAGLWLGNEELQTIDFSESATDKDVDRIENATKNLLGTSGGGAVLNANYINNTAAFNAWLKSETEFAISPLLPQLEGFTNRMLINDLGSNDACKVEYFPISVYTREDLKKSLLESCQYGFTNKLFYNTLNGVSEKTTLAMAHLENDILGLQDKLSYPLSSSYTTSNTDVGRPQTPDSELSPSGERSRNA